jgi:hypothetical protein
VEMLDEMFERTVNNHLNEIIPSSFREYLQMKYVVSPRLFAAIANGIINN